MIQLKMPVYYGIKMEIKGVIMYKTIIIIGVSRNKNDVDINVDRSQIEKEREE